MELSELNALMSRATEFLQSSYKKRLADLETEWKDKEMPLEVINEIGELKDKIK